MNRKSKILILLSATLIVLIIIPITYDILTINNQYYINEANLKIPIFVYHNIVNDSSEVEFEYMQTTKEEFEKQISGLIKLGYKFITYDQLKKYKNNEIPIFKKSCILTFDDGYEGIYKNAYPIAQKYNIPFCIFIITQNMNQENVLTWEQAKKMEESGLVTIASHSTNHLNFEELTTIQAINNVNDSYKIIEENLGTRQTKIFTYPYGLHTEEQILALEKESYIQNLTDNKINKSDKLDLSRLHRCYPLRDSVFKIICKIIYRSIRYD